MNLKLFQTTILLSLILSVLIVDRVEAQFNGHNSLGDFGLLSGSQPDPGFYASGLYYRYYTDKVLNSAGEQMTFTPQDPGDITINAYAGLLWWVSNARVLGANYGIMAVVPFANATIDVPILGLEQGSGTGFGDLYVQPINLGWRTPQADFTSGLGIFIPTGKYEIGGDDNSGLGMWSIELYAGTSVFFDKTRSWHFATTAFYETHSEKKDSNVKVGDLLTLEGGLGKSFYEGALSIGAAYYAQWKISEDDPGLGIQLPIERSIDKHRVFAAGPDITLPLVLKSKLIALVNARFFWEFGARTKTQGHTLTITATFPIPSVLVE